MGEDIGSEMVLRAYNHLVSVIVVIVVVILLGENSVNKPGKSRKSL